MENSAARRLLVEEDGGGDEFDTNMVVILAALLMALICALGLNSIVRCAMRVPAEEAAGPGVRKRDLRRIRVAAYGEAADITWTECAICLAEFAEGEKVRVLPNCNHGFHVACIDRWLLSKSSCPICRLELLQTEMVARK